MKKVFLGTLSLSLIILLTACGNPQEKTLNETTETQAEDITSNNDTESYQDTNESETDYKVTEQECMVGCEEMWRFNQGNKGRSESDMKKDCSTLCNATQGIQNNDMSACERSEGMLKDTCYSDIATDKKDVSICENISDGTLKKTCYISVAEATKDITICEKIEQSDIIFKQSCLESVNSK